MKFDLGLATDGDADRFSIIDDRNRFVAKTILALLAVYRSASAASPASRRSVATTHLIDAIPQARHPLYETPVGFKYIGGYSRGQVALGGESAGMSMSVSSGEGRHPPCLLVAEMVARTKRSGSSWRRCTRFEHFYSGASISSSRS
jgi:phosphomannomutase